MSATALALCPCSTPSIASPKHTLGSLPPGVSQRCSRRNGCTWLPICPRSPAISPTFATSLVEMTAGIVSGTCRHYRGTTIIPGYGYALGDIGCSSAIHGGYGLLVRVETICPTHYMQLYNLQTGWLSRGAAVCAAYCRGWSVGDQVAEILRPLRQLRS